MDRISFPMEKFRQLRPELLESEEGVGIVEKYDQLVRVLNQFVAKTFEAWSSQVDSVSLDKLNDNLLKRFAVCVLLSSLSLSLSLYRTVT